MLKIIFMGTPDFAKESLQAIDKAGHQIVGVVTNSDKPKGRGMKMMFSPVKEYAIERNFKIYQPLKVRKNTELIEELKALKPDVICVVAYGKILPKEVLEIPTLGCINVHGSLLPKYRGAAPIQWAVINGEKETGITTMYMDVGMDTGDMILKKTVPIGEEETTGELWNRLALEGAELLVETLKQIEQKTAPREKQPEEGTLAPMLDKQIAKINWEKQSAEEIKNLVRGLNPIMGAYCLIEGKKLKLWKVKNIKEETVMQLFPELKEYAYKMKELIAGTVLFSDSKKGLFIKANEGIIQVLEVQAENARKMEIGEFLRGNEIIAGTVVE